MAANGITKLKLQGVQEFGLPHDRFRLLRKLCNGGMGEVHACERLANGDQFAVKIINRVALATSPRNEVLLRREIRTLRELNHPNVVSLHDAFWDEGNCYIVMDLAREGDLREKIRRNVGLGHDSASSEEASRYVASQLIRGIRYMHQRRVIHRDLKAENILVISSKMSQGDVKCILYDVKITDFGLSTWLDIVGELLTPCGTPNYLAPEIMKDNYDERIDFWSFGVVLYMMLCGDFPFDQYHNPADVERILHQSIKQSPSWQLVSDQGKDIVCGLLVFNPDQRLAHGTVMRHPWLNGMAFDDNSSRAVSSRAFSNMSSSPSSSSGFGAAHGAVKKIQGWTGSAVDSVSIQWHDGTKQTHGALGGFETKTHTLANDEIIMAVSQETREHVPQHLGNSIALFTSACQVIAFQGLDARTRGRFAAPAGSQICGLQFCQSSLIGIHLERIDESSRGSIASIRGKTGYAVDYLELELREGGMRKYGCDAGGFLQGPWTLQEDEHIVVVEQAIREEYLGNSIAFFTSKGQVFKLSGVEASYSRRFSAPPGRQICGLEFESSMLACVRTCPAHMNKPQQQDLELHVVC